MPLFRKECSSSPIYGITFILGAGLAISLTGCSGAFTGTTSLPGSIAGAALHGSVHGGQQAVTGASVYLYAAGTTGYASTPTSLLNTADSGVLADGSGHGYVLTNSNGGWSITSDYTCPSPSSQVYLLALGGNPGLAAGTNNAALAMMAALGSCSTLSSATSVNIDEITTIASVYALSHFATFSTMGIATSSTNTVGLANAFATVGNLVSLSTGLALTTTPGGLGVVPQPEIDSLANILSVCVNSNGITGGCPSLFAAATPTGGTAPTTTLQAAFNIARYPASNVTALFNLQPATPPFQPVLPIVYSTFTQTYTGVPNDWTIPVTYNNNPSWGSPNGIAADSKGNIWVASGLHVIKLDPLGNQLEIVTGGQLGANNYNQTIAIDLNDDALIDDNSYWVSLVDSLGNNTTLADTPPPLGTANISGYGGVVVDASNNYWAGSAANNSSALVKFSTASGTGILGSYTGGGLVNPIGLAIDYSGDVWLTNSNSAFADPGTVTKFSAFSGSGTATSLSGGGMNGVAGIAFDASQNAWVTNTGTNTLTELSNAGTPSAGSPYSGGGLTYPSAIAVDGDGNFWMSNWGGDAISEFSSTGAAISPALGYFDGLNDGESGGITVDASGNVWLSDWGGIVVGPSFIGGVTEVIGVAAPTITPIALALKNHTIGTRP